VIQKRFNGGRKMYIDTRFKESIEKCFCEYLDVCVSDLDDFFQNVNVLSTKNGYTDGDILNRVFDEFISERLIDDKIESFLFYHLSRRLKEYDESEDVLNLEELLTTENSFSRFLRGHKVEFVNEDGKLEIYYNGQHKPLDNTSLDNVPYLRWRLGHTSRIDYCINGFMLRDRIFKNNYARTLWFGPEIIQVLAKVLQNNEIQCDYLKKSVYYCYEYCIPKTKIIFDDKEELLDSEKTNYFLIQILQRLYDYYVSDSRYLFDHDNSILRLSDDVNLSNSMLVSKFEITSDMIK